jgi:hypothetical protein
MMCLAARTRLLMLSIGLRSGLDAYDLSVEVSNFWK